MNRKWEWSTTYIVRIAIFSALTYIATWINVPMWGANGGLMHLGTLVQTTVALVFGPFVGAMSGAIGMTLFDYFSPYAVWAPVTLVVRLLAGLVIGLAVNQKSIWIRIGLLVSGSLVVVLGYYVGAALIYGDWLLPLPWTIGDLVTAIVSSIAAFYLAPLVSRGLHVKREY